MPQWQTFQICIPIECSKLYCFQSTAVEGKFLQLFQSFKNKAVILQVCYVVVMKIEFLVDWGIDWRNIVYFFTWTGDMASPWGAGFPTFHMTRYWHSCLQDHQQQQTEYHSRSLKQKWRQHHSQSWWHGELLQSAQREELQLNVTVFVIMTWRRIRWGHYRAEHLNECEIWEILFEHCVSDIARHDSYPTLQVRSLSALRFDGLYKMSEQTFLN